MINKPKEIPFTKDVDLIAEPKFDGMRGIIKGTESGFDIFTERNKKETLKTLQFPEIVPNIPNDTILDGEICIPLTDVSADFEAMQKRMNLQNKQMIEFLANKNPCKFMAFDILKFQGKDLTDLTYKQRRGFLDMVIQKQNKDRNIELVKAGTPVEIWHKILDSNGEGMVLKNLNGNYQDQWIKKKNWKEKDFRVFGVDVRSQNWVLNLADQDNRDVGSVTLTGYDKTKMKPFDLVGKTAVVKFLGFGKKVRIPILKEIRS